MIFNIVLLIGIFRSSQDNILWLMPQDLTDDKSTLVQVMAWCHQATSHCLSQCWLSSLSPYDVARPQWVIIEKTFRFRYSLYKNKKVIRSSYFYNGNSSTGMKASLLLQWPSRFVWHFQISPKTLTENDVTFSTYPALCSYCLCQISQITWQNCYVHNAEFTDGVWKKTSDTRIKTNA